MSLETITFEHPLNEKMRTWLRIEFLLSHLHVNRDCMQSNALLFFHSLSELLEIVERNDIRGDLIKDLELQKQKLLSWMNIDGVDLDILTDLLAKLDTYLDNLALSQRLGLQLKDDRFISSIRQRLMIPGGCCSFDLPSFHLWLKLPQATRNEHVQVWLSNLSLLHDALTTNLQLTRQLGQFHTFRCDNNFSQEAHSDTNLIRIRVPLEKKVYPQVSGHMHRYSIRFLSLEVCDNIVPQSVEFELACC